MKTDIQLKQDIEAELIWDPKINAAKIGISVDKGVVSLRGDVDTYAEKWAAEDATRRVGGVRTVAQYLKVRVPYDDRRDDSEIAAAVQNSLSWDVFVPTNVTAKVTDGYITLMGAVNWNFEREAAEKAVRYLMGVAGVINSIELKPEVTTEKVKEKVQAALMRQATADSTSIKIETAGGRVTLTGSASSWKSIDDASAAAWAAPGVTEVIDRITVR